MHATKVESDCVWMETGLKLATRRQSVELLTGILLPIKPSASGHRVKRLDPVPSTELYVIAWFGTGSKRLTR